jgi:hypothetical protein
MNTEQTTNNSTEEPQTKTEDKKPDVVPVSRFNGVLREVDKRDKMIEELQSKLNKFDQLEEERKAQKAKEAGQFEELESSYKTKISQLEEDMKIMATTHQAEMLRREAHAALVKAGAKNDAFIAGHITSYLNADGDRPPVADWVSAIKSDESNAPFFAEIPTPAASTAVGAVATSSRSWESIKADLHSKDPEKVKEASKMIQDYVVEHGKMPY